MLSSPVRWFQIRWARWKHHRDERYYRKLQAQGELNAPAPARRRFPSPVRAARRRLARWNARRDEAELAALSNPDPAAKAPRPLVRERYWEFRHWLWEQWQAIPTWPILARVTAGILPIVLLVSGFFVVRTQIERNRKKDAGAELQASVTAIAGGKTRVLVAGDTYAWALATMTGGRYEDAKQIGFFQSQAGCSIIPGRAFENGAAVKVPEECEDWVDSMLYSTAIVNPQYIVFHLGPIEAKEHRSRNGTLPARSPQLQAALLQTLEGARQLADIRGARMLITTSTCSVNAVTGTDPDVVWLNAAIRQFAKAKDVTLADFDTYACAGGVARKAPNGRPVVIGSVITKDGAPVYWQWIRKQIDAVRKKIQSQG